MSKVKKPCTVSLIKMTEDENKNDKVMSVHPEVLQKSLQSLIVRMKTDQKREKKWGNRHVTEPDVKKKKDEGKAM